MATPAEIEEVMARLKRGFDKRWNNLPEFRARLEGKDRDIVVDLGTDGAFHLVVRNGFLERVVPGDHAEADARVTLSADTLMSIVRKELHPVAAFTTGRVKVKAPLRDIMLVRAFLGG